MTLTYVYRCDGWRPTSKDTGYRCPRSTSSLHGKNWTKETVWEDGSTEKHYCPECTERMAANRKRAAKNLRAAGFKA